MAPKITHEKLLQICEILEVNPFEVHRITLSPEWIVIETKHFVSDWKVKG